VALFQFMVSFPFKAVAELRRSQTGLVRSI
jgi:hypothetical protein